MEGTGFARGTSSLGLHPELTYLNHKGLWYVAQQKLRAEGADLVWSSLFTEVAQTFEV